MRKRMYYCKRGGVAKHTILEYLFLFLYSQTLPIIIISPVIIL